MGHFGSMFGNFQWKIFNGTGFMRFYQNNREIKFPIFCKKKLLIKISKNLGR